jgi:hypothetical protein
MALARGPLFSLSARGTVANAATYRRGRNSAVVTRKPSTPAAWSAAQTSHRDTIATLASLWRAASAADHATWDALALPRRTTRWAEYSRENLARLRQGLDPTTVWPPSQPPVTGPDAIYITYRWDDPSQVWLPYEHILDTTDYNALADYPPNPTPNQLKDIFFLATRLELSAQALCTWDADFETWDLDPATTEAGQAAQWTARPGRYNQETIRCPTWDQ